MHVICDRKITNATAYGVDWKGMEIDIGNKIKNG
jgi:hypothetical protein